MTISSTTVKNSYSGDGSSTTVPLTIPLRFLLTQTLQVIIRSSTGTETVQKQ
jgi:hypothetical protein